MSDSATCHTCPNDIDLEAELAIARRALAENDLAHAAFHIAGGLVASPTDAGVHALIDAILERDAAFELAAPKEGAEYAGRVALRALLARRRDDDTSALGMLLQVHRALPHAGFVALIDTLFPDARSLAAVDPASASGALVTLLDAPQAAGPTRALLGRLCEAHPASEALHVLEVRLLRMLGQHPLALDRIEALVRRLPSWLSLITLGSTYREMGQTEKAKAALLRAAEHDPTDDALHLDLGDWAIADEDWASARHHYEQALQISPDQPWALASLAYLAALDGENAAARATLRRLAVDGNTRAQALHAELVPFDLTIDPPGSAVVNVAKQVRDTGARLGSSVLTVSSYEPSSAVRAAASIAGHPTPEAMVSFGEIPTPDPRVPRHPVEHPLWTFREPGFFGRLRALRVVGRPALDAPPPAISDSVVALALTPWSSSTWYTAAQSASLARSPVHLTQLLGAMVNTPDLPATDGAAVPWDADEWSFRTMVAAAFLIASSPGPWLASPRRTSLLSALHGPTDWTTTAAIVALGELARQEPEAGEDVMSLLQGMVRPESPVEATCVHDALRTILGHLSVA